MIAPVKQKLPCSTALPAIVVLLLALVGYGFLLTPGMLPYSPHSDFPCQGLGTKTVLYRSLQAGHGIPFWRWDELSGNEALTNPQSLYTYPLHFLFYLLEPARALGPTFWLHFLAAGVAGYVVGATLGLGAWARLLMAAAMMFSFKLIIVNYAGWLPAIPGIVMFPLLFAAVFHALKRPGVTAALAVGGAGALCLHAGHLQLFYYSCLFLGGLVVARLVDERRAGGSRAAPTCARRALPALAAGGVLAVGLTAYLLIPLASESSLISRGDASAAFFMSGHPFAARHLATLFYPEALGTPVNGTYPKVELWEDVAYFGIIPLALAIMAMILSRRRPLVRFLRASFLISLAVPFVLSGIMAISPSALGVIIKLIPGFSLFRLPGRFLFLTAFFGICLAGFGLEELLRRLEARAGRRWAAAAACLLIAVIAAEGSLYARRYLGMIPVGEIAPKTAYEDYLGVDHDLYRIAPARRDTINYGWAATLGLQLVSGFDPFNFNTYGAYFDIMCHGKPGVGGARVWTDVNELARWDLVDALNVKYVLSPEPISLPPDRFAAEMRFLDQPSFVPQQGFARRDIYVYRNERAHRRAFFVSRVHWTSNTTEATDLLQHTDIEDAAIAIGGLNGGVEDVQPSPESELSLVDARAGLLHLQVNVATPQFLVISEVYHPGWRATLDGVELPLYQTDVALLGARLPAGKHDLMLRFRPMHWNAALATTGLSVFAVIALATYAILRLRGSARRYPREESL